VFVLLDGTPDAAPPPPPGYPVAPPIAPPNPHYGPAPGAPPAAADDAATSSDVPSAHVQNALDAFNSGAGYSPPPPVVGRFGRGHF